MPRLACSFFRFAVATNWIAPVFIAFVLIATGCRPNRKDLDTDHVVRQVWEIDDVAFGDIVQFENVFWEPDDTISLRRMIIDDNLVNGRDVLEIGTGTGLLAIVCLQNGADSVLATDVNPAAIANARYNAAMLETEKNLQLRLVPKSSQGAFDVLRDDEAFDVILSNPPWEDGTIHEDLDHAFYDPGFALMDSLLQGLPKRLRPGGRCLVVYGNVSAIKRLREQSTDRGIDFKILDERSLDDLEENFLPGMLIELTPQPLDAKTNR
ncbi:MULTISPECIES: 50S ribosomal protein L11 methyltransferase [Crateriforma]|uniref:N5-glutamine S-adenosyl-L-methionine-dependent methyltransferase n=1 Tax=Crateriforma conspicua TaxID=2527996 RepID=A0A5C6FSN1_9PLAN|nr:MULTISPECIES: 50S ribosomal protein L11 methyltransferase [Crateriforma]TWU65296.1 N5-glutamine S-adenosyl-L-methionine-dependent methyltransferase [Crateriforma conspicua]